MTDPISNELLPCPFCGGKSECSYNGPTPEQAARARAWGDDVDWQFYGECTHCGATGPGCQSKTEAIAAWNRRQSPAGVEPVWFAVQSASGAHIGMWQDELIARRVFEIEYPDGKFIPLYASPPPKAVTITDAARDVLTERRRQIEVEGWTPEHDDQHANGEMAAAAACYAFSAARSPHNILNTVWPWSLSWWKPKDKRRDLVKAAALILAEIERLDRAAALSSEPHNG